MTHLEPLRIVPAGAGSGKTYSIQHQLGDWIASGKVRPERVVAVTYTEAAATELRERISARLLEMGRVEDALRLAQAYISTIHGFGLRVLTEFAFEAGASPRPRLLNDDEESALIRRALARTDKANAIADELAAFGYSYDWGRRRSPVEVFRDDLLRVLQVFRTIGLTSAARANEHVVSTTEEVVREYGRTQDGDVLRWVLKERVEALLRKYPKSLVRDFGLNKTAKEQFRRDFHNLREALQGDALEQDWKLWQGLRELRTSKRNLPLPKRYDELASAVSAAADDVTAHPGPLRQACVHLAGLLTAGQDILRHYEEAKRGAGLVDYTDMIAMSERLLRTREDVRQTLAARIDCLVVDEFQDTNPLQFALLWTLRRAGIPTLVVGDLKQAIMGFQGADPRLFEALTDNHPAASSPLTRNWRSQPELMRFINAVGPVLFGDDYSALVPQAGASRMEPLEFVGFKKNARSKRHAVRALAVGMRLQELLEDPNETVKDRRTGSERRLRGGDIAVLCPTNGTLAAYADVLRTLGLRVNCKSDGWLSSRPVQIAWHALSYLANSADRHAALYLAVTELGSLTLEEGLRQLMDGDRIEDPLLRKLDDLAEGVADRTVFALLADTLEALNLFDAVASWPDSEQQRANLVHLMGAASEFMDANREALAHGGYHGSGVQTFLAWLEARAADDDLQPEKKVLEEDAVVLRTWHGSKGLEWPVVAVCGLERKFKGRLPHIDIDYQSFDDLSRILRNVRIEYWPRYAVPEKNRPSELAMQRAAEKEARRLLYVVLTRAREKLVLEWPHFLERKERKDAENLAKALELSRSLDALVQFGARSRSYWSLLRGRCRLYAQQREFKVGSVTFPCHVTEGGSSLPADFVLGAEPAERELAVVGRRAIRPGSVPAELTPESRAPSALDSAVDTSSRVAVRSERYGEGLDVEVDLAGTELGTFLHRCFEILGNRPDLVDRIPELTGVSAPARAIAAITSAVARFEAWLSASFQAEAVLREWPLLMVDVNGSVISGTADLIVQTAKGVWILDHKSDRTDDPAAAFQKYRRQLGAYAQALAAQQTKVLGVGIHWIRRGEVTWGQTRPRRTGARAPGRSEP